MNARELEILALSLVPGMGPVTYRRLIEAHGSPRAILERGHASLETAGMGVRRLILPENWPPAEELLRRAREESELCASQGVRIFAQDQPGYPARIRQLHDPPLVVYVKGSLDEAPSVAIVGSRRASVYGQRTALRFARELAAAGVTVVSGMALGIDGCAHEGALAEGGRTVAVLGGGLGKIYPQRHQALSRRIAVSGALLTEYPYGQDAQAGFFPVRNRILAALADAVVVAEAAAASGSLITADAALELGREVCAVPGNVDSPGSVGTNRLIQQGATPVTCAAEVLEALALVRRVTETTPTEALPRPAGRTGRVWELLGSDPLHVDELAEAARMGAAEVLSVLSRLELDGRAVRVSGQRYVKS